MTNPNNENLPTGSPETPGPQPQNQQKVSLFSWQAVVSIITFVVVVAGLAYMAGKRDPDKFIAKYETWLTDAQRTNDSILNEVKIVKAGVIQNEEAFKTRISSLDQTIVGLRSDLRKSNRSLDTLLTKWDSQRVAIEDSIPADCDCSPVFRLADSLRIVTVDLQNNLKTADTIITRQEERNSIQMLRIENLTYGFTRVGVSVDTLGNILGSAPRPPSGKFLGLFRIPDELKYVVVFTGGAYVGSKLLK